MADASVDKLQDLFLTLAQVKMHANCRVFNLKQDEFVIVCLQGFYVDSEVQVFEAFILPDGSQLLKYYCAQLRFVHFHEVRKRVLTLLTGRNLFLVFDVNFEIRRVQYLVLASHPIYVLGSRRLLILDLQVESCQLMQAPHTLNTLLLDQRVLQQLLASLVKVLDARVRHGDDRGVKTLKNQLILLLQTHQLVDIIQALPKLCLDALKVSFNRECH